MAAAMRSLISLALLLFCSVAGAVEPSVTAETARLASLGRLWGRVRYQHPHLAWKKIDWDRALLDAIPAVRAAVNRDTYRAAVERMLAVLGDPETRVYPVAEGSASLLPAGKALEVVMPGEVLVARLRLVRNEADRESLTKAIGGARAVVLDLRINSVFEAEHVINALASAQKLIQMRAASAVPRRYLQHLGYQDDLSSASLVTTPGAALPVPAQPAKRRIIAIANHTGTIPEKLLTLLADGQAELILDGNVCGVPLHALRVPLGEGLEACVRIEEIADGRTIDVIRTAAVNDKGDSALARALALAQTAAPQPAAVVAPLPLGRLQPEQSYAENHAPSTEYRLLALFRYWNMVRWFDPHIELFDQPWESQLEAYIPKLIAAESLRDYQLIMEELAVRTDDSHAFIQATYVWALKGEAAPPLFTDLVEGQTAVVACLDAAACAKAGVQAGDVVVSIDGKPAAERWKVLYPYETGSNAERRNYLTASHMLWGPEGSTARIELRDGRGQIKKVELLRREAYCLQPSHSGEVFRVLAGNVGYIDLTRLQLEDIEPALDKIRDTPVTILDMRGYPHGRIWDLVGRFNTKHARYGAIYRRPTLGVRTDDDAIDEFESPPRFESLERIPPAKGALYRGKTIMLVNADTLSQAEHLGLHFEAANGTVFFGLRSAGADGGNRIFRLPGSIFGGFTGEEVRHSDGRQLQRIGLAPLVQAHPTLAGLRAGRDEVLEQALKYASTFRTK